MRVKKGSFWKVFNEHLKKIYFLKLCVFERLVFNVLLAISSTKVWKENRRCIKISS